MATLPSARGRAARSGRAGLVLVFAMVFAMVTLAISAGVSVAVSAQAAAASALDEVTCSFYEDYVDSDFAAQAGMPLAIAVAGDELPAAVLDAFGTIEDGRRAGSEGEAAIVGYFTPICGAAPPAPDTNPTGAASSSNSTNAADSTVPTNAGSQVSESVDEVAPELLASTGATPMTWILVSFATTMLAAGLWILRFDRLRILAPSAAANPMPGVRAERRLASPTAAERIERRTEPASAERSRRRSYWLLDENAE